jgi:D-psicose/D-tagatose/L-ribulose 3-epimerase
MKLSISNIAWDVDEDLEIANLLNRYNIDAIDIAPSKYFADPATVSDCKIDAVRTWWSNHGIEIVGMQALLFGTTGLNIFGSPEVKIALLEHLSHICRIGSALRAKKLVFGSPKNRDRSALSDQQTIKEAVEFFGRLGDIAKSYDVVVCLEPNPHCYDSNFMVTSIETADIVRMVNNSSIQMQFDSGALTLNNESAACVLTNSSSIVGHIHISEPNLLPLGSCQTDHSLIYQALNQFLPNHFCTIEMLATKTESHLISIERAVCFAIDNYHPSGPQ